MSLRLRIHTRIALYGGIGLLFTMPFLWYIQFPFCTLVMDAYLFLAVFTFCLIYRKERAWNKQWQRFLNEDAAWWEKFCREKRPSVVGGGTVPRSKEECLAIIHSLPVAPRLFLPSHRNSNPLHGSHPCDDQTETITEHDLQAIISVGILDALKDAGVYCYPTIVNTGAEHLVIWAPLRQTSSSFVMGTWATCLVSKRHKVALVTCQASPAVLFRKGRLFHYPSDFAELAKTFSAPAVGLVFPFAGVFALPFFVWSCLKGYPFSTQQMRDYLPLHFGGSAEWVCADIFLSLKRCDAPELNELAAYTALITQRLETGRQIAQGNLSKAIAEALIESRRTQLTKLKNWYDAQKPG